MIELHGLGVERLLRRAVESGMRLENMQRVSYTVTRLRLRLGDYFRLRRLAGEKITIKVCKAGGMTKVFLFVKKRWWLAAGCVLAAIAVWVLSSLCYDIRINGLETINEYDVYQTILENGGNRFVFKDTIDLDKIEWALRVKYPKLSYVYAAFDGVYLVVRVDEGELPPEIASTEPAAVYAKKSGIVSRITVCEGKAAVTEGEKVKAGQVLIDGSYEINGISFLVSAHGDVIGKVDYVASSTAHYESETLTLTGKTAKERWMRLGQRQIKIGCENPLPLFVKETRTVGELGSNMPIHAEVIEITYKEAIKTYTDENKENAIIEAREAAYYKALKSIPEGVAVDEFHFYVSNKESQVTVTATLTVLEEIGERRSISGQPLPKQENAEG